MTKTTKFLFATAKQPNRDETARLGWLTSSNSSSRYNRNAMQSSGISSKRPNSLALFILKSNSNLFCTQPVLSCAEHIFPFSAFNILSRARALSLSSSLHSIGRQSRVQAQRLFWFYTYSWRTKKNKKKTILKSTLSIAAARWCTCMHVRVCVGWLCVAHLL